MTPSKQIFVKHYRLLLALLLTALQLPDNTPAQTNLPRNVSYAPLSLSVNGGGTIAPYYDGQMLRVGSRYVMAAIPNRGFTFTHWNLVNIVTIAESTIDVSGATNTTYSTIRSPSPERHTQKLLNFTQQPVDVLFTVPGVRTITRTTGWQANFEPTRKSTPQRTWFSQPFPSPTQ